tara:strand:- start:270 stop:689 length:420 start_codon:yes stop_codon:yes gene_type:complete
VKIINLNNVEQHHYKIEQIIKYGKYDKFWIDFANNRKTTKEDYRNFVYKVYPQALSMFNDYEGVKKNLIYFHTYWQLPFYLIGKDITPRDNIMFIFNESVLNIYNKIQDKKIYTEIADVIYFTFFTPKRISEFKKLKVI